VTTEDEMGSQFVTLLQGFYECHDEYAKNPLYISGESYAGRYIPFIAKWIIKENEERQLRRRQLMQRHSLQTRKHSHMKQRKNENGHVAESHGTEFVFDVKDSDINLQGLAIGNGIWDPFLQFQSSAVYAHGVGVISESQMNTVNDVMSSCMEKSLTVGCGVVWGGWGVGSKNVDCVCGCM